MSIKPSLSKGTRDFGPEQFVRRQYIIDTIKNAFELFGFQPLETPAIEKLSTLTGKYGDEGDQLLFKILRSGDYLKKVSDELLASRDVKSILPFISERGLRYDLTVPFARYVVMNQDKISFPFKRYQIQTVWRADRPQKGRYQEFYQCDADIIGSDSLLNEAELIQIIQKVYRELKIDGIEIKLNNRKILQGIAEEIGAAEKFTDLTIAIDKLDKIGIDKVIDELLGRGLDKNSVDQLKTFLTFNGSITETLEFLENKLVNSEIGKKGIEEMKSLFSYLGETEKIKLDITLARGLSYYTGTIIEVVPLGTDMKSSINGGGRYDDLTGVFGMPNLSGVGFSFGLDRIYDIMLELDLFNDIDLNQSKLLFINFDENCQNYTYKILGKLREKGIKAEIYPSPTNKVKMKKQMKYANDRKFPFVVITGSDEMDSGLLSLKNMATGEQEKVTVEELLLRLG